MRKTERKIKTEKCAQSRMQRRKEGKEHKTEENERQAEEHEEQKSTDADSVGNPSCLFFEALITLLHFQTHYILTAYHSTFH